MSENNRWLSWKMKRGLAYRGRPAPLHPKGFLASVLYHAWFRFHEVKEPAESSAVKFTQHVGGTLGAAGKTNGE